MENHSFLRHFHDLSREMHTAAMEGRWEEVAILERKRMEIPLQEEILRHAMKEEDALHLMQVSLKLNQEVLELARSASEEVRHSLETMKLREKAANAYVR